MSALAHLEPLLVAEQAVMLAYSGGLDSSVLLHQLVLLRRQRPELRLRAVHIHHGLSPHADGWAEHCRQQCAQWQVALEVVRVQLDVREGGVEAAARAARYQALRQRLKPGETLLTAQHQDDQSETLLLALKRGSGPAGLAAMPLEGRLGEHRHLRPLLAQSRGQLERWAAEHQLCWIEDESNQDPRYDRNFLRLQVLPLLASRWPHFAAASARSAALCGEQEQLLDELLAESLQALVAADGSLDVVPLLSLSEARRSALMRRWIARCQGGMPSRAGLQKLWQEVVCARPDAEPRLRIGKAEVRRFRERLYWLPLLASVSDVMLPWPAPWKPLPLPGGLGELLPGPQPEAQDGSQLNQDGQPVPEAQQTDIALLPVDDVTRPWLAASGSGGTLPALAAADACGSLSSGDAAGNILPPGDVLFLLRPPLPGEAVSVRFQAQGRFHIVGRNGSRPLKKLWQELAVPPWQRERIPLIFYGDCLMAAAGLFITREAEPQSVATAWQIRWRR
ncbi:tRNA lysidine(34) synthetase TilS [Erwinia sp. Leaf53]|uniref:tRNA lysidine(34) synthetase TilS n=1 Tax=Erwinia sp. Leaf53 TaxID=1736225 RepID=UPI0006FEF6AF|nr:tRNA lysidine(34) synthetase TilS [Erwinia sp. Leaf53]KQN58224.1 tRNA(Ile)-lysidine synthase [Erwinia sp. Leaf53]